MAIGEVLAGLGVTRFRIEERHEMGHRFVAMATRPNCAECGGAVSYLVNYEEASGHDRLACWACDGMFELAALVETPVVHLRDRNAPGELICCDPLLGPFGMGRKSRNRVVFRFSGPSSYHLEIRMHEGTVAVRDLQSTNGTYVNGHKVGVEWTALRHGDRLMVGDSFMRVELLDRA